MQYASLSRDFWKNKLYGVHHPRPKGQGILITIMDMICYVMFRSSRHFSIEIENGAETKLSEQNPCRVWLEIEKNIKDKITAFRKEKERETEKSGIDRLKMK